MTVSPSSTSTESAAGSRSFSAGSAAAGVPPAALLAPAAGHGLRTGRPSDPGRPHHRRVAIVAQRRDAQARSAASVGSFSASAGTRQDVTVGTSTGLSSPLDALPDRQHADVLQDQLAALLAAGFGALPATRTSTRLFGVMKPLTPVTSSTRTDMARMPSGIIIGSRPPADQELRSDQRLVLVDGDAGTELDGLGSRMAPWGRCSPATALPSPASARGACRAGSPRPRRGRRRSASPAASRTRSHCAAL